MSLDEFIFRKVFCPVGSFLNRATGKSTATIGFFLIVASEAVITAIAALDKNWLTFMFDLCFLSWLFYWPRKVLKNMDETIATNPEHLPSGYDYVVFLRVIYNYFFIPLFLALGAIDLYQGKNVTQTVMNLVYGAGWNIASMLWPKRKSWAREKIENRKTSQILTPALVRV